MFASTNRADILDKDGCNVKYGVQKGIMLASTNRADILNKVG